MTATALPLEKNNWLYRICPVLNLKIDLAAERLIIFNAVASVVFLLIGGTMALLLGLTRWQAIHLLPSVWYYRALTAHGFSMLVAWIVFFEIAGLYFGSAILLNARMVKPVIGWIAFALMVVGGLMVEVIVFMGKADVLFTAYVPLKADPLFYLGMILFAVGALVAVIMFFVNVIVARKEKRYEGSVPLVVYGLITAAVLAVYTLLSGAVAFVPAFLWSINLLPDVDTAFYRNVFWSFGHPAQQVNLAAMVSIWYMLAAITTGAAPVNEKLSRWAFVLYMFFINLGSAHHLLVDPGPSFLWKTFNTSYGMYLAVLGSMIHAFSIPAALEIALRKKTGDTTLFGWLWKGPWREPGFSSLVLSMFIFGWIGGVTGVTMGTEQINMVQHNTLRVPGHFHSTVVSGTTLAFMGLTYYLIPLIFRRQVRFKKLASWQPYVYAIGMVTLSLGMIGSGIQGVPRRSWDISYVLSSVQGGVFSGTVNLTLAVVGIGAIIAVVGGIMFMIVVLSSVFTGKKEEASRLMLVTTGQESSLVATVDENHPAPKGAFALVLIFLFFFVSFYLANWWLLGRAWFVR